MNGIYPDYVGPSLAYRFRSLYPDWVGDGTFEIEAVGGGGSGKQYDFLNTPMGKRLLREDEEVLAVVMVAMRVLQ